MAYDSSTLARRLRMHAAALRVSDAATPTALRGAAESVLTQMSTTAQTAPTVSTVEIELWYEAARLLPSTATMAAAMEELATLGPDSDVIVSLRNEVPEMDMLSLSEIAALLTDAKAAVSYMHAKLDGEATRIHTLRTHLTLNPSPDVPQVVSTSMLTDDPSGKDLTAEDVAKVRTVMRGFGKAMRFIESSLLQTTAIAGLETVDTIRHSKLPAYQRGLLMDHIADIVDDVERHRQIIHAVHARLMAHYVAPMQILRDVVSENDVVGYPTTPFETLPACEGKLDDLQEHIRSHRTAWIASVGVLFGPIAAVLAYFGIRKLRASAISDQPLTIINAADMVKLTGGIKQAIDVLKDISQKATPNANPDTLRQLRETIARSAIGSNLGIAADHTGKLHLTDNLPEPEEATVLAHGYTGEMLGRAATAVRNIAQYSKQSARAYDSLGAMVTALHKRAAAGVDVDAATEEVRELTAMVDTIARAIARASRQITNTTTALNRAMATHRETDAAATEGAVEDSASGLQKWRRWVAELTYKYPILSLLIPGIGWMGGIVALGDVVARTVSKDFVASTALQRIWETEEQELIPFPQIQRMNTVIVNAQRATMAIMRYTDMHMSARAADVDMAEYVNAIGGIIQQAKLPVDIEIPQDSEALRSKSSLQAVFQPVDFPIPKPVHISPAKAGYTLGSAMSMQGAGWGGILGGLKQQMKTMNETVLSIKRMSDKYEETSDPRWTATRSAITAVNKAVEPIQKQYAANWRRILMHLQSIHDRLRPNDAREVVRGGTDE